MRVTLGFENTNDRAKHYRRRGCATSKLPRYKAIPRSRIGLCFVLDIEQFIELYFLFLWLILNRDRTTYVRDFRVSICCAVKETIGQRIGSLKFRFCL